LKLREPPAHAARLLSSDFLAGNWPEIAPNIPFLPNIPVRKWLKTNDRPPREQHGMEEVVGSIPTRSTISLSTVYPEFHSPIFSLPTQDPTQDFPNSPLTRCRRELYRLKKLALRRQLHFVVAVQIAGSRRRL
jgi:hypothetical protein